MPIIYTQGDPFLTRQHTLALGYNCKARTEVTALTQAALRRYPAALASFRKQVRHKPLAAGSVWFWHAEAARPLLLLLVRESPFGATRSRYVDAVALRIARDYRQEGIRSLAIAPLGQPHELPHIQEALALMLARSALTVVYYTAYLAGVDGEAHLSLA